MAQNKFELPKQVKMILLQIWADSKEQVPQLRQKLLQTAEIAGVENDKVKMHRQPSGHSHTGSDFQAQESSTWVFLDNQREQFTFYLAKEIYLILFEKVWVSWRIIIFIIEGNQICELQAAMLWTIQDQK